MMSLSNLEQMMRHFMTERMVSKKFSWFHKVHQVQSYPCLRIECRDVIWDVRYTHPEMGFLSGKVRAFSDGKHEQETALLMQWVWCHLHHYSLEEECAHSLLSMHFTCGKITQCVEDKNDPYGLYMDFSFDAYVREFQEDPHVAI